ncbi:unnamed protein product [Linum tenue]|uniref:CCHC-type domain-containing protein n=1 Tax=Linum tenue TaxID=586396 RepID=A0AAV0I7P9_9ROSI|nr:unnamed protein product [Linum tenue]
MLSTANNGLATPAPGLLPSDRPPDTMDPSAFVNVPGAMGNTAPPVAVSDMAIDSATLPVQVPPADAAPEQGSQPTAMEAAENQAKSKKPAQAFTYAKAVAGLPTPLTPPNQLALWTPVGEHDLITGSRNGEPALTISTEFKTKICAPWQRALVVRLLGLRIGFITLCNRLKSLWRPTGNMEIKDLDHDCFLVKLDNEQDYFRALTDGPWVIFDHYLVVQQWTPSFKASDPLPKTMIVWVQLPALKIHFYHKEVVTTLGNLIGRTIKLDYHTLTQQRAKFARLAVEVDLSKQLVPRIWLDDAWQKVEYENLPEVCFECGRIGHCSARCPLLIPAASQNAVVVAGGDSPTGSPAFEEDSSPGFGPWMLVSRKSRRNSRDFQQKGKVEKDTDVQNLGQGNKQGKRKSGGKEGNQSLPSHAIANGPLPQKNQAQERKATNGQMSISEIKKGVVLGGGSSGGKGKGLLGPKPDVPEPNHNRSKPKGGADEASTSAEIANYF